MLGNEGSIERILQQIVGNQKVFSKLAIVDVVDKDYNDCDVHLVDNEDIKYFNVKFNANDLAQFVAYPKIGSTVIISFLDDDTCFISQLSEIEGYYISNEDNSFLDLMNDLFTAISNIQLQHPYGPTTPMSVINQTEFDAVQDKFKNLFLK